MSIPFADRSGLLIAPATARTRWQERREDHREQLRRAIGTEKAPPRRETTGRFIGLCVLIGFPDRAPTIAQTEVEAFCNETGYVGFGNNGSVADYFRDASTRKLEYSTIVLPYYQAQHEFAHYDDPNVPWAEGARELVTEALKFHVASGVDFHSLSVDDQQAVYAINVFYAGEQAQTFSQGLWPHSGSLSMPVRLANGRVALDYQMSAIGAGLSLGVYCHENGHMLCEFPDLYDRDTCRRGVGRYCLMCQGCVADPHNPPLPSAYLRWKAGWGQAQRITAGPQVLGPGSTNQFLVHRHSNTEYLLFEFRSRVGRDAALPDSGLAVWHVDELGDNFDMASSPARHQECRLLQADGRMDLDNGVNDGDSDDLFDDGSGPIVFVGQGNAPLWWDGTPTGLQIRDVRVVGQDIHFTAELT